MRMFPGNESEKPVLRETVSSFKERNNIEGRTIQIADKGLNCAQNIIEVVNNNDCYIFSKSFKQLKDKEKLWALLDDGFVEVKTGTEIFFTSTNHVSTILNTNTLN